MKTTWIAVSVASLFLTYGALSPLKAASWVSKSSPAHETQTNITVDAWGSFAKTVSTNGTTSFYIVKNGKRVTFTLVYLTSYYNVLSTWWSVTFEDPNYTSGYMTLQNHAGTIKWSQYM